MALPKGTNPTIMPPITAIQTLYWAPRAGIMTSQPEANCLMTSRYAAISFSLITPYLQLRSTVYQCQRVPLRSERRSFARCTQFFVSPKSIRLHRYEFLIWMFAQWPRSYVDSDQSSSVSNNTLGWHLFSRRPCIAVPRSRVLGPDAVRFHSISTVV
mgnify:CR=1 FL=1